MIGRTINDRYRIESVLGQGGMGTVYKGYDTVLKRDIAVKMVTETGLGTEGRARLLHEAQSIAKLNHPNIVTVHDVGEYQQSPFIVMEYVEGSNLNKSPPEEIEGLLTITRQICTALEHAHANDIIHRDLKPENVIITRDGSVKLMDFGLARSIASRLTTEGTIIGTVFYMAPEMTLGDDFDARVDLYALGVMLYEWTTGDLPFTAGDPLAVISQHIHAPVVPPNLKNEAIPSYLNDLILQMLRKNPDDRPAASEVLEILSEPEAKEISPSREFSTLDRIVRGRIIGREQEYQWSRDLWNQVLSGGGKLLLISGEPGIGKTRLMQEISAYVEVSGGQALVGTCHADRVVPYSPFAEIVLHAFRRNQDIGDQLPEFVLADLITLAPGLRTSYLDVPPNPQIDPQTDQNRLFENFIVFCKALSNARPLLLVVDDAHWGDSNSLALLLHLARRTQRQRVLLLATYREVELDETRPFNDVLMDFIREGLADRMKLSRLNQEQTRDMLANLLDDEITPEFLEGIYRVTEGNPFFIEEVCKTLVNSGSLYFEGGEWHRPEMDELEIPQSVRVAIQSRVNRLPENVRDTLQIAAILGREFEFNVLADSSDLDEDMLIGALEVAEGDQLIAEVSGRKRVSFAFTHALIPATLEEGIRTLRRRRMHVRVAGAIEKIHPEDFESLAHHYGAAGDLDRALNYTIQAAQKAAAAYANLEAENHYRAALDVCEDPSQRAYLLGEIGRMQDRQSRHLNAIKTWRQAVEIYRMLGNLDKVADFYSYMGRAAFVAGEARRGLSLHLEGLAAVEGAPESYGLARLLSKTASSYFFNAEPEDGILMAKQALAMAERLEAIEIQADTLNTIAMFSSTPMEERFENLNRAIKLSEGAGFWRTAARAHNNITVIYGFARGDITNAISHYLKAAEISRMMGMRYRQIFASVSAAWWNLILGNLIEVEEQLQEFHVLVEEAQVAGLPEWMLRSADALLCYYQGELETAADQFSILQHETRAAGEIQLLSAVDNYLGEIFIELNQLEKAEPALLEAVDIGDRGVVWGGVWPRFTLARMFAQEGASGEIRRLLKEAESIEVDWGKRVYDTLLLRCLEVELALVEDRWEDAGMILDSALAQMEKFGFRVFRSQTLMHWADAHLAGGLLQAQDQAREIYIQAQAEFKDMGSEGYVSIIQEKLAGIQHL